MKRRAIAALSLALSCDDPASPPAAKYCGVTEVRVPVTVGATPYVQTLIIPRRCPTEAR